MKVLLRFLPILLLASFGLSACSSTGTGGEDGYLTVNVSGLAAYNGRFIAITVQRGMSFYIEAGSIAGGSFSRTFDDDGEPLSAGDVTITVEYDTNDTTVDENDTTETGDRNAEKSATVDGDVTVNFTDADFSTIP